MRFRVFAATFLIAGAAHATSATLSPGATQSQVAAAIDALQPGDTLTLGAGDYPGVDLDLRHKDGTAVAGTSSAHVTIAGTGDAHVIANADQFQEAMRIRTGCAFVDVKNLHLSSRGGQTQAGIFIDSGVHDIAITNNVVEDTTGIGIQAHSMSDVHDILIEGNDVHDTGTNTSDGNNGGQGFQAGGFDPSTATTNVFHITVRHNAFHHITGQDTARASVTTRTRQTTTSFAETSSINRRPFNRDTRTSASTRARARSS